jgi:hypothetical protein
LTRNVMLDGIRYIYMDVNVESSMVNGNQIGVN